jgi:hypothetical protein
MERAKATWKEDTSVISLRIRYSFRASLGRYHAPCMLEIASIGLLNIQTLHVWAPVCRLSPLLHVLPRRYYIVFCWPVGRHTG